MVARPRSKRSLAGDAWRYLFDFILATATQRDRVLEQLDLSPGDGRALSTLDPTQPRTMRELAETWECDASTATWMVDRLEKRNLAQRRPVPGDRRVKAVVLTKKGTRAKQQLMAGLYEPPPELMELDAVTLERLRDDLAALAGVTARRR
jgi:DNA-binding MarR family transcriptional regulator